MAIDKQRLLRAAEFLKEIANAPADAVIDADRARDAIATCLALKDPRSPMKTEMFDAFALHATSIAVEGVCFRREAGGRLEVLLEHRDDPLYRGCESSPGTVIRVTDSGPDAALERLTASEFRVPTRYEFVRDVYLANGRRGWFESKVYLAFPERETALGRWFPADPLPPDSGDFRIVSAHRDIVLPAAIAGYKAWEKART